MPVITPTGGGSGGSQPALGLYQSDNGAGSGNISVLSGSFTNLPWGLSAPPGDLLLDLTDPANPVIIETGVYAFNFVFGPTSDNAYLWYGEIDLGNAALEEWFAVGAQTVSRSPILPMTAGDHVNIGVQQSSGNPHNFTFLVYLARIS